MLDVAAPSGARAPYLESHRRLALDGAAPEELLLHTIHPGLDGAWEIKLFAYAVDDAGQATPIPGPMQLSGEQGRGSVTVADLDGDGHVEIIAQGGTDGERPRPVSIFALRDGQMVDQVWSISPGAELLVADGDGDGRREIIGLTPLDGGVQVSALSLQRGMYRPAAVPGLAWLPAALIDDLRQEGGRAHARTAHLLTLALDNGLRYRGGDTLQVTLEARYEAASTQADREVFVDAMAWTGDPGAIFFLRSVLSGPGSERPLRAVGRTLGMLGDQEGLTALLEAELLAGRYEPELFLGALEGVGPSRIARFGRDRTIAPELRARLVEDLFVYDPSFSLIVRDLLTDRSPALAQAAAQVLEQATRDGSPAAEQWLALFPADDLLRPLRGKVIAVRRDLTAVMARKDEPRAAALLYQVLAEETDITARHHAVRGLMQQSQGVRPARHLDWLTGDAAERDLHHRLIGLRGDPALVHEGLERITTSGELDLYAQALSERLPAPAGEEWEAVGAWVIAAAQSHPDASMRQAACALLGATALPGSAEALATAVAQESETMVLTAAVEAVAARKMTAQAPTLIALLPDADPLLRPALLSALVALNTSEGLDAVAALLSRSVTREMDAPVLAALERSPGIQAVRTHVKALIKAEPVDCHRAGAALLSLVRAGDGATDDVVADLAQACPDDESWLVELFAVWAEDPLLAVQIRPFREHERRSIRVAAEEALLTQ